MTDKIKEVLMFGFESQDFVNDLIGKERLDQAAHQLNQMLIEELQDVLVLWSDGSAKEHLVSRIKALKAEKDSNADQ